MGKEILHQKWKNSQKGEKVMSSNVNPLIDDSNYTTLLRVEVILKKLIEEFNLEATDESFANALILESIQNAVAYVSRKLDLENIHRRKSNQAKGEIL